MGRPYEEEDSSTPITSALFPIRGWFATGGRDNTLDLTGWMYAVYGAAPSTPVLLHGTLVVICLSPFKAMEHASGGSIGCPGTHWSGILAANQPSRSGEAVCRLGGVPCGIFSAEC
jgi:hypothetical protein